MSLRAARDLQQVISKLGLDRSMDLVQRAAEYHCIEFLDHLAGTEFTQIPAAFTGRTLGMFFCDFGKIRA